MILYIILLVVSLALYWSSPDQYNLSIILASLFVFLVGSVDILWNDFKKKNYFSFNTIFLLSFFLVTYCFPLFVYNTEAINTVILFNYVNFDYITIGCSISTVAICCYFIGYKRIVKNPESPTTQRVYGQNIKIRRIRLLLILSFLSVVVSIIIFLGNHGFNVIAFTENPFFYEIFKAVLAVSLVANAQKYNYDGTIWSFIRTNKLELILSGLIAVVMMYFGDRGLPITICLFWLTTYSFYYSKIKFRHLIVLIVVGAAFLFVIRETRTSDSSLRNSSVSEFASTASQTIGGNQFVTIFSDLYGASQELCTGIEIKKRYGLFYPEQIVIIPFTPLPLVPSFLSQLIFNEPWYNVCPTYAMNDYITSASVVAHFGNHVVVDIFMRWGLLGTVLFFYLFGMVPSYFSKRKYDSVLNGSIFLMLIATSLYVPRSSMFDIIRSITYVFVITLAVCNNRIKLQ